MTVKKQKKPPTCGTLYREVRWGGGLTVVMATGTAWEGVIVRDHPDSGEMGKKLLITNKWLPSLRAEEWK